MDAAEWLRAFSAELNLQAPSPEVIEVLLEVAGTAAHASERKAAPIACFMAGVAGIDAEEALAAARRVPAEPR